MIFVSTLFLILGWIIFKTSIVVVPTRECAVVERLGKFLKVVDPGLHVLLPFFDRIAYFHEMREEVLEVPPQNCITKDNIQVEVDGLIYLKVWDPQKASYGINNYRLAAINLAQTTMRSEIGKLSLHQSFSERENLNLSVVKEIDKASESWGVKVLRYEIMNILPSQDVVHTLEQAMEAERDRRAEVTLATAHKEAMTVVSEGKRQEAINISEGEKERRINEAKGRAMEIELLAQASSYAIAKIAEAREKPFGKEALQTRIMHQYIDEFGKIIQGSQLTVVPKELAQMKSFFEGWNQLSQNISQKK